MRESITLFVAVVLCLLLCHPIRSLNSNWFKSIYSLTSETTNSFSFPAILSIQFKFDDDNTVPSSAKQLRLVPAHEASYFKVDWSSFSPKHIPVKLYNSAGKFIGILQEKNIYSITNQLNLAPDNIKLSPGIYYAYAQYPEGINTQNGYAKFVVK